MKEGSIDFTSIHGILEWNAEEYEDCSASVASRSRFTFCACRASNLLMHLFISVRHAKHPKRKV